MAKVNDELAAPTGTTFPLAGGGRLDKAIPKFKIPHHPIADYLRLIAKLRRAALELSPQKEWSDSWCRFKFVVRGVAYGPWMQPWFEFLNSDAMRPITAKYPRLHLKVQWPYLNTGYGPARRLEMVRHHYQFALEHFSAPLIAHLLDERFLCLARWNVPGMGQFSLRLSHENKFGQEGEMILGLYQDGSERLCALLCFSITAPGEISIGCSQGGKPDATRDEISAKEWVVALTRRMCGCRPKNLLLFALRRLARIWSIERLRAVSTDRHVWRKQLSSNYDAFWEEIGGTLESDGMYDIPISAEFKPLQEIKTKKRAMYRDRYQFLGSLGQEIEGALADTGRTPIVLDIRRGKATVGGTCERESDCGDEGGKLQPDS